MNAKLSKKVLNQKVFKINTVLTIQERIYSTNSVVFLPQITVV